MCSLNSPYAWEESFPPVFAHTSTSFLKQRPGYREGKNGDIRAASRVVGKCANPDVIMEIRVKHPDSLLLPVVTQNRLPEALANITGMYTYSGVYAVETMSRKSLTGMERLLHKPVFAGKVIKGKEYVIVDDIVTQGGTVSALRKYVIANGGRVASVTALSCSPGSSLLAPSMEELGYLACRFKSKEIGSVLKYYNIASDLSELTRAQLRYLLLFKELDCLITKIEATQIQMSARYLTAAMAEQTAHAACFAQAGRKDLTWH